MIGDEYGSPKVRLPGSGGACEIAIHARRILVIMRQAQRSFVERLDFRTSPGNTSAARSMTRIRTTKQEPAGGREGRIPVVVTDLGIYHFDQGGEMRLDFLHPGATVAAVRDTIGWQPRIADDLAALTDRQGLRLIGVDSTKRVPHPS